MAYTVTKSQQTIMGNQRVWQGLITPDAATGVVSFGFKNLLAVQATAKSAASSSHHFSINELAAGTASAGDLAITGVASGDDFYVTVYGV
jgi:hypothetical protein